jgi:hypothetical protein
MKTHGEHPLLIGLQLQLSGDWRAVLSAVGRLALRVLFHGLLAWLIGFGMLAFLISLFLPR